MGIFILKQSVLCILDRRSDGIHLAPLSHLVVRLEHTFPELLDERWTIKKGAEGYGTFVMGLLSELEKRATMDVLGRDVMDAIGTNQEWFDNAQFHVESLGIYFGIHDNTCLYFRGTREQMKAVAEGFIRTQLLDENGFQVT
jgi:hypothetical protein